MVKTFEKIKSKAEFYKAECRKPHSLRPSDGTVRFDTERNLHPPEIEFDEEHKYPVDKVLDVCRAACQSVGGVGVRYTVRIQGKERYLWRERTKWFVEALK